MKLPDRVPPNDPVTVCSECKCACCALGRFRCVVAKSGPVVLEQMPLAVVRSMARENPSYWKPQRPEDDYDLPLDLEELESLISWSRTRPYAERPLTAGYLEHELGIDPEQVAAAMAKEWPEEGGAP